MGLRRIEDAGPISWRNRISRHEETSRRVVPFRGGSCRGSWLGQPGIRANFRWKYPRRHLTHRSVEFFRADERKSGFHVCRCRIGFVYRCRLGWSVSVQACSIDQRVVQSQRDLAKLPLRRKLFEEIYRAQGVCLKSNFPIHHFYPALQLTDTCKPIPLRAHPCATVRPMDSFAKIQSTRDRVQVELRVQYTSYITKKWSTRTFYATRGGHVGRKENASSLE